MSIDSFSATAWSASLLKNLLRKHVFAQAFNKDYEGDVTQNAALKINSIGHVTIGTYAKNTDLSAPETLNTADQTFQVDQGKTLHFYVDDLDKAQQKGSLREAAMQDGAWGFRDAADTFLATTLAAGLPSANTLTAATVGFGVGETDPYAQLVQLGEVLDNNNVPEEGRLVFVPNWYEAMMRLDPRWVSFGTAENLSRLKGTQIKDVSGFAVLKTNNYPTSNGNPVILATYPGAQTWAEGLDKMEPYRPQLRFGDAVKGLYIYGAKVTRPLAIAGFVATKGSYS